MRRSLIIILLITVTGFFLVKCTGEEGRAARGGGKGYEAYAGGASCISCHRDVHETHVRTSHFRSSAPATENTVLGSFSPGHNRYAYSAELYISMEKRDSGLFQAIFFKGEKKKELAFGISVGSGAKGQTYLYWDRDRLLQMPISYFTDAGQWSVSPGFRKDKVVLDKPITTRCLECHTTYATLLSGPGTDYEVFDRSRILFGIDCERCHGPAASHVKFHQENPGKQQGEYVQNPSAFSRQQKLDMCVLCHGGNIQKKTASFSFQPGDRISDHFVPDTTLPVNKDLVDVHGNQYGLLRASKCFQLSQLTCLSCHDPHREERGQLQVFSRRCMNCHSREHGTFCKVDPQPAGMEQNCIDCHMPRKPSMSVTLFTEGKETPSAALIRTHLIRVYPEETAKYKPLATDTKDLAP